jgi:hypothetical protein
MTMSRAGGATARASSATAGRAGAVIPRPAAVSAARAGAAAAGELKHVIGMEVQ